MKITALSLVKYGFFFGLGLVLAQQFFIILITLILGWFWYIPSGV